MVDVDSWSVGSAKIVSAVTANVSASSTFLANPVTNRITPWNTMVSEIDRWSSAAATSRYRTIGPAMSCGNIDLYAPNTTKLRVGTIVPRYTSTR